MKTVLVTGASGLAGRAICDVLRADASLRVVGQVFTRTAPGCQACDLRDPAAITALLEEVKPDAVVHCAAERRPDVCEADEASAAVLNVDAVWHLGRGAAGRGAMFIHLSTDYLFDGTKAPYTEDSKTCPVNAYGRSKVRAEHAALAAHPHPVVLRVPVLYGPTDDWKESAVTTFAAAALAATVPQVIDSWQIRVPLFTPDIGHTVRNILRAGLALAPEPRLSREALGGIWHYSS